MLIDTHCHINIMVKDGFDRSLTDEEIHKAVPIIAQAQEADVTTFINVGTSISESENCLRLAHAYPEVYATVGIHPNDISNNAKDDLKQVKKWIAQKESKKIVGIGECGLDYHYPDYDKQKQKDVFQAQIELACEHDMALVVHTRDAGDDTLRAIEPYRKDISRGVIHCFSEDRSFAQQVIDWGFVLGLGGTITYPKNNHLREVAQSVPLETIVLETDAPFLPPQSMRGKKNSPANIAQIAAYLSQLRGEAYETISQVTTENARRLFKLPE